MAFLGRRPKAEKTSVKAITAGERKAKTEAELTVLEEERVYHKGVVSVRDIIAPASLQITPSYLKLGDTFLRTIFVVTYPRYIAVGWFGPVVYLSPNLDIG